MRVKVRAVIPQDGRIVVASERRVGAEHLTIPGGRPKPRETLVDAAVREVREETGLDVAIGPLLYVAEVVGGVTTHELNLLFLATAEVIGADVTTAGPEEDARVMPPVLATVLAGLRDGWPATPRFLGNVHRAAPQP